MPPTASQTAAASPADANTPTAVRLTKPKPRVEFRLPDHQAAVVTAEFRKRKLYVESTPLPRDHSLLQVWAENIPAVTKIVPKAKAKPCASSPEIEAITLILDNRHLGFED